METLQTTLELMGIDSGEDEIDPDFEREMLESNPDNKTAVAIASKQTNQQINRSSLDDRIIEMEFATLQERISNMSECKVPFGRSGMVVSAVAFKNITLLEKDQLQINANDISTVINKILEKLNDPSYLCMATINLITDDLYQERFYLLI